MNMSKNLIWSIVGIMLGLCIESSLFSYAIFNRSSDPNEIISMLVFKDDKSAIEFFNQLGWTQRVEDVTDKSAAIGLAVGGAFYLLPAALTIASTKIAEKSIIDKYLWHGHTNANLITPAARTQVFNEIDQNTLENINFKTADIKGRVSNPKDQQKQIADMIAAENSSAYNQKLPYATGTAWWWRAIDWTHGNKGYNPFVVFVRIPTKIGGLPSIEEIFQASQQGIKYMQMDIVGSHYINRAAVVDYKGTNEITMYLPFVDQKYSAQINKDGIPSKDIQWLTADDGKQKKLLLYQYMTGSTLSEIQDILASDNLKDLIKSNKAFDRGLSLIFQNSSDHPVHAFFLEQKNLAAIVKAGGWTQKSVEQLLNISKTVVALGADAATGLPVSMATNLGFGIFQGIVGNFPEKAAQAITLANVHPMDHFDDVYPGSLRYSYFGDIDKAPGFTRPATAIKSQFSRTLLGDDANFVVAIFPCDDKRQPDFSKPEFIGNFDRTQYNGVIFWPTPGQVDFIKFDPESTDPKTKVTKQDVAFGVPVELTKDGAELTAEGKEILKEDISNVEKSAKIPKTPEKLEEIKEAEKLIQ